MGKSIIYRNWCAVAFTFSLSVTACQWAGSTKFFTDDAAGAVVVGLPNDSTSSVSGGGSPERVIDRSVYLAGLQDLANGDTTGRWPVSDQPLPAPGALLPNKRIVAFYGNLYSARMGILGELPPDALLDKLDEEVARWNRADSVTEAVPALHYIAVTAQGNAGRDGKYRARMPFSQIDSVLRIAHKGNAIVFLDIQVGFSTLEEELPRLDTFLRLPQVHLGIDPEFSMKDDMPPGKRIGHFTADDINFAAGHLARLVREHNLPPKVLVVHRFTKGMVRNYDQIELLPEVQIVVHMDGWGAPALKKNTYETYIAREPVQFTGFKFFYKNDLIRAPHRLMRIDEVMALTPQPSYIQYQ